MTDTPSMTVHQRNQHNENLLVREQIRIDDEDRAERRLIVRAKLLVQDARRAAKQHAKINSPQPMRKQQSD